MNYYTIDWDYDNLGVIGHNPQVELKKGYNPDLDDSIWKVRHHFFPNFVPNVELELHSKAKWTNFIDRDVTYFGMFVDDKFKNILENFKLPSHTFYTIKIYQKKILKEYNWFHYLIEDFWEWLDRDKSKGVIIDNKKQFKPILDIDLSYKKEEILKISEELPYHQHMKWEKIVFKPNFPKYDVYEMQTLEFGTVISERLLNALQKAGMTGFSILPCDKIICE